MAGSSSGRTVRVGVVGAGGFAEVAHVPGLRRHPQAEVVVLCGRNAERARAMADRLGVPEIATDYRDVVGHPDLDAITVATPDAVHYDVALAALRAGKHVFCEKPLTKTVEQARELEREATARGLINMVAFTFRYTRALERLREMVAEDAIGKPTYVSMEVHWPSAMNPEGASAWRNYAEDSAAGIFGDMGVHFFDVIQHVLSPVTEVAALTAILPRVARDRKTGEERRTDALDLTAVLLRTDYPAPTEPPRVQGHIVTSWMTPPRGHNGNVHVSGTTGALNATLTRGAHERLEILRPRADWQKVELPAGAETPEPAALPRMMGAFVDAILRGHVEAGKDATFLDGLRAQLALDTSLRAAQSGRWEPVPAS